MNESDIVNYYHCIFSVKKKSKKKAQGHSQNLRNLFHNMVIFEYQYSYIKNIKDNLLCFPHQIISNASLINVKISNIIKKSCKRTFPHIFWIKN